MEKERVLREFVERVKKKYKGKIERIVLFGSLARGVHRETSDTDRQKLIRYAKTPLRGCR